jgi:hypothetical protein
MGGGARFVEAFVEITSDPVVIDIDDRLPWYRVWRDEIERKFPKVVLPNPTLLSPYMLVRDGSS